MEIVFATKKLEHALATNDRRVRKFGPPAAKVLTRRLAQLQAAPHLGEFRMLPGSCHELHGDRAGQLAIEVTKGMRLVFKPTDNPPPTKPDSGLDCDAVVAITILEVTDYHGS